MDSRRLSSEPLRRLQFVSIKPKVGSTDVYIKAKLSSPTVTGQQPKDEKAYLGYLGRVRVQCRCGGLVIAWVPSAAMVVSLVFLIEYHISPRWQLCLVE